MKKKVLSLLLSMTMAVTMLAGCAGGTGNDSTSADNNDASSNEDAAGEEGGSEEGGSTASASYDDFLTIDVFGALSNYMGTQSGWFGEVVKQRYNMELNIIAPNVAGGGDTLYQTRTAAGELGDLVIVGAENGRIEELIAAGLILDLTEYLDDAPHLQQYMAALDNLANYAGTDGYYGVPLEVSSKDATEPGEASEPTFGPYLRWDLYAELGYPEMENLTDLLDVLEEMQALNPTSDSGQKTYAISLFPDWDGNMLNNAKQPTCYYGYDELGFVLAKADGSDYQSIIDDDSMYVEVLEFFNEAYKRGLVDPESSTQSYDNLYAKYEDGAVLFSFWPWLCQAAYNTSENLEAGKGFMLSTLNDMEIFSYGSTQEGSRTFIGVGSNAKDPKRLVDFIDWLYSPEGVYYSASDTQNSSGPEGLTWEMIDGEPHLTELGVQMFLEGTGEMPEEFGGGTYSDGICALNVTTVRMSDIDPNTGYAYDYTLWPSYQEDYASNPVLEDWAEQTGYYNSMEYLRDNNLLMVAPGTGYITPEESTEVATLRAQTKSVIVANSWQMVYSETDEEFTSLLKDMQEKVIGLGYNDVLDVDMQNAKDQNDARVAAAAAVGSKADTSAEADAEPETETETSEEE